MLRDEMTRSLIVTLALNVVFVNAAVWLVEMAGRTLVPSLHLAGTTFVIFLVFAAQLLLRRFALPTLISAGIPLAFFVVWLVLAEGLEMRGLLGTLLTIAIESALFWGPLLVMNRFLLPWGVREAAPKHAGAIMATCAAITTITLGLTHLNDAAERKRAERDRIAAIENERQRIQQLRDAVAMGDRSKSCELFGSDPFAKPETFEICKQWIEELRDPSARWKELAHFVEGSNFKSWSEQDRVDGGSFGLREPVVPKEHQRWFVQTYLETWMRLDDAEIVKSLPLVYGALLAMNDRRSVEWTEEAHGVVKELSPRLIERVTKVLDASAPTEQDREQAKALVRQLEERR